MRVCAYIDYINEVMTAYLKKKRVYKHDLYYIMGNAKGQCLIKLLLP